MDLSPKIPKYKEVNCTESLEEDSCSSTSTFFKRFLEKNGRSRAGAIYLAAYQEAFASAEIRGNFPHKEHTALSQIRKAPRNGLKYHHVYQEKKYYARSREKSSLDRIAARAKNDTAIRSTPPRRTIAETKEAWENVLRHVGRSPCAIVSQRDLHALPLQRSVEGKRVALEEEEEEEDEREGGRTGAGKRSDTTIKARRQHAGRSRHVISRRV